MSERLLIVAKELLERTRSGQVRWESVGSSDVDFRFSVAGGGVVVVSKDATDDYHVYLFNASTVQVDRIDEDSKHAGPIKELYEVVHDKTLQVDETYATLEEELGLRKPESWTIERLDFVAEDQEFARRFDFGRLRSVILTVQPTHDTDTWRIGWEFSRDGVFSGWRYGPGHPLWHLTKNPGEDAVTVDYYDMAARHVAGQPALAGYKNEVVLVRVTIAPAYLDISVGQYNQRLPTPDHRFGRLYAWADGRPYQLSVSATATA